MALKIRRTHLQFIKFCTVGLVGTTIHFGILAVLVENFMADHELWATTIAFIGAVVTNFLLNKFWTFSQKGNIEGQFIRYLLVASIGLGINNIIFGLFLHRVEIHYIGSQAIATIVVAFWNFYGAKKFVFYDELGQKTFLLDENRNFPFALTVIIPAYNEAARIEKTLYSIRDYFHEKNWRIETIVVDDFSNDNTVKIVENIKNFPHLRCIRHHRNLGKGAAIKTGFWNAHGEYFLFMDADGSTDISEFEKFIPSLKTAPIIIGSRYVSDSNLVKAQSFSRKFLSRWGNRIMRNLLKISIQDTQCGFKLFYSDVARFLASRQTVDGYAFDMELLAIATLHGFSIKEVGIHWYDDDDSRVRFFRDGLRSFRDLVRIKVNMERGFYTHQT